MISSLNSLTTSAVSDTSGRIDKQITRRDFKMAKKTVKKVVKKAASTTKKK